MLLVKGVRGGLWEEMTMDFKSNDASQVTSLLLISISCKSLLH